MNRVHIVCSGGAGNGILHLPALRELHAMHGFEVTITGGSTGAINAVAYALGKLDLVEDLYFSLPRWQRLRWPWQWPWGIYDLEPVRQVLLEHAAPDELRCPVYVHLLDVRHQVLEVVCLNELPDRESLADAVIASCSQHIFHAWARFRGRWVADPGGWNPMPAVGVRPGDQLYALSCKGYTWRSSTPPPVRFGWARLGDWVLDRIGILAMLRLIVAGDHRDDYARLQRQAAQGTRVVLVEPKSDPGDPFEFNQNVNRHRLELGEQAWDSRLTLSM